MNRKRLIRIGIPVAAAVLVILLIVALVIVNNRKPLGENINATQVPKFSKTVGKLDNWYANPAPTSANSYQDLTKTNILNITQSKGSSFGTTTSKTCNVIAQTAFLPSYQAGAGDAYLSKNALYAAAQVGNSVVTDESTAWVNSNQGKVEFVTGKYESTILGGTSTVPVESKAYVMSATRAIDSVFNNGAAGANLSTTAPQPVSSTATKAPSSTPSATPSTSPAPTNVKGLYGSDAYKGVPVLTVTYTCYNKQPSATEFQKILNALTVQL